MNADDVSKPGISFRTALLAVPVWCDTCIQLCNSMTDFFFSSKKCIAFREPKLSLDLCPASLSQHCPLLEVTAGLFSRSDGLSQHQLRWEPSTDSAKYLLILCMQCKARE